MHKKPNIAIENTTAAIDAQIADITAKIEVERKVLQGASSMYRQLEDPQAREACEANMVDSKRRLEYLEGRLRDVALAFSSQPSPASATTGPATPNNNNYQPIDSSNFSKSRTPSTANSQSNLYTTYSNVTGTSPSTQNLHTHSFHHHDAFSVGGSSSNPTKKSASGSFANLFKSGSSSYMASTPSPQQTPQTLYPYGSGGGGGSGSSGGGLIAPLMPPNSGSDSTGVVPASPVLGHSSGTAFDLIKYGNAITTEKVKYRLTEILHKLDTEQKVKTGTENLLHAMVNLNAGPLDQRVTAELRDKMAESNAKINVLEKAKHRYNALYVAPTPGGIDDEAEDSLIEIKSAYTHPSILVEKKNAKDVRRKCNGRLKLKLIGALNLVGRTSSQNEIIATVAVDGNLKYTSRRSVTRWDETLDVQVDRAQEVEICVYSHPGGMLLGLVWFKLSDLEDDLKQRYPAGQQPVSVSDVEDVWLDLEPAGQILIRACFVGMNKTKTQRDQVFRREAVQKAFLRNGHKFYAVQSLLYQCAVCNEFSGSGTQWYQCQ
ncbi:Serine/threonine kinase, partial [Physocladia obscura]